VTSYWSLVVATASLQARRDSSLWEEMNSDIPWGIECELTRFFRFGLGKFEIQALGPQGSAFVLCLALRQLMVESDAAVVAFVPACGPA